MSLMRPVQSPLLVGRDDLLVLADRGLEEAAARRGQALLLAGEAGIGKSRLVGAILRKAEKAGFRVAQGDLSPYDRQVTLALIMDLARSLGPSFGSLGRELLDVPHGTGADSLASRRLLVRSLADLILAGIDRPTLLAFEDLQWADELSLELVGELARHGRDLPLFVLAAYRLDELPMGSFHREWRARLLSQRQAEEVRLRPLTREETALVVTMILGTGLPAPREVVQAVHERTDGIPLHVEELLAALDDAARTDGRAIREATVPDTIQDAVLARAGRLSAEARAVARAGAVVGRCFIPEVLAGCLDRPVAELEEPLQELVAQSFLFPFSHRDRGYYDFRHQLLRDALYSTVAPSELRRLHARAAEFGALMEGGTEVHASLHFERAGLRPQAYRAALTGAEAASAVSSRQEAFELYQRAVANAPADLPALELANLYSAYSDAASAVDDIAVTRSAAATARRHYLAAGDPLAAALMLVIESSTARKMLEPPAVRLEALDRAEAELAHLPPSDDRDDVLLNLLSLRVANAIDVLDLGAARAATTEMRAIAERLGDGSWMDAVAFDTASVQVLCGEIDRGLTATLDAARHSRDSGFESAGVTAYRNVGVLGARAMRYDTAEMAIAEGIRYADEVQQSYCRHMMAATSAMIAWTRGRWDEAVEVGGLELVEPGSPRTVLEARDALGYVAFGRGELERARELLGESRRSGSAVGEAGLVLPATWGLAETSLVGDDPQGALELCETALRMAVETGERALLVPFVVTGTRAALAARRPEAAERWVGQLRELLAGWMSMAAPAFDHAEGLLRTSAGATVAARASLEAAVEGWERAGRAWEALWARLDLATCLLRSNREAEAVPIVGAVRGRADEMRSDPLLRRCDELLAIARSRGVEAEPWRPLTAREFEVARLVAAGMTNAAIGEEIRVSPRTVGSHVEHILDKLGATRRAEIAAWVATVDMPTAVAVGR